MPLDLDELIVVADSAMLSKTNIEELDQAGYRYFLSGRIKNELNQVKQQILTLGLSDGQSGIFEKQKGTHIVVNYALSKKVCRGSGLLIVIESIVKSPI